jgi:hypothetical protein
MKTTFWGPPTWVMLFSSVAGSYPVRVDPTKPEHMRVVRSFKGMFRALRYTLPCFYCRQSFAKYLREVPLDDYDKSRRSMMHWLYLVHDLVNKKLIAQEKARYAMAREKILAKGLTEAQTKRALAESRQAILRTTPSPPFEKVLATYERQRSRPHK